jgi:hypothetical protein
MTQTQNPLNAYDIAVTALREHPDSPELMHRAVLALAQAGSLDFALAEYTRYGLDTIRHHEDIMALGGRLYKDLYLSHSGKEARNYAQLSSQKYEAAFQDCGGYYAGINAATMALIGGTPDDIVHERARTILTKLPTTKNTDKKTLYFIEATRAEAHLLRAERAECETALRAALMHDPLNYPAHASTVKQFRMILDTRQETNDWLSLYCPPSAAHYTGHIFGMVGEARSDLPTLTPDQVGNLSVEISDKIQTQDIGFGFGSLAAGADIIIAETMLEEGCELHIILPVAADMFKSRSVTPYGTSWEARFDMCLTHASSVETISSSKAWPTPELDQFASMIGMGSAVNKAGYFSTSAAQLLIWDEVTTGPGTATHAQNWQITGRPQHIISYPGQRASRASHASDDNHILRISVASSGTSEPEVFDDIHQATKTALDNARTSNPPSQQGLHITLASQEDGAMIATRLANAAVPGAILVSEAFAQLLAVSHFDTYRTDYLGKIETGERVFSIRAKGNS